MERENRKENEDWIIVNDEEINEEKTLIDWAWIVEWKKKKNKKEIHEEKRKKNEWRKKNQMKIKSGNRGGKRR